MFIDRTVEDERIIGTAEADVSDINGLEPRGPQRARERARKIFVDQETKHAYPVARTSSPAMWLAA